MHCNSDGDHVTDLWVWCRDSRACHGTECTADHSRLCVVLAAEIYMMNKRARVVREAQKR